MMAGFGANRVIRDSRPRSPAPGSRTSLRIATVSESGQFLERRCEPHRRAAERLKAGRSHGYCGRLGRAKPRGHIACPRRQAEPRAVFLLPCPRATTRGLLLSGRTKSRGHIAVWPICGASRPPCIFAASRSRLLHIRRTRSAARVRRREPRSGKGGSATCHLFGRGRFHPVSSDLTTSECSGTETKFAQLQ